MVDFYPTNGPFDFPSPKAYLPRRPHAAARFWARVEVCQHGATCQQCCWPWHGAVDHAGYGRARVVFVDGAQEVMAHRVAWILWAGTPFPSPLESSHSCHMRACCNPHHVCPGTHQAHILAWGQRDLPVRLGGQVGTAKLTPEDIARIWYLRRVERKPQHVIAQAMGVSQATISHILSRKTWAHLPVPVFE
jgi:hypothetical protein